MSIPRRLPSNDPQRPPKGPASVPPKVPSSVSPHPSVLLAGEVNRLADSFAALVDLIADRADPAHERLLEQVASLQAQLDQANTHFAEVNGRRSQAEAEVVRLREMERQASRKVLFAKETAAHAMRGSGLVDARELWAGLAEG